jgi:hypothetical protein
MGNGAEMIRNSDEREAISQGISKRAGIESEGDNEPRHYIYNFS